eukprot:1317131-Amorphochlora_amoeboformis.AAC.2
MSPSTLLSSLIVPFPSPLFLRSYLFSCSSVHFSSLVWRLHTCTLIILNQSGRHKIRVASSLALSETPPTPMRSLRCKLMRLHRLKVWADGFGRATDRRGPHCVSPGAKEGRSAERNLRVRDGVRIAGTDIVLEICDLTLLAYKRYFYPEVQKQFQAFYTISRRKSHDSQWRLPVSVGYHRRTSAADKAGPFKDSLYHGDTIFGEEDFATGSLLPCSLGPFPHCRTNAPNHPLQHERTHCPNSVISVHPKSRTVFLGLTLSLATATASVATPLRRQSPTGTSNGIVTRLRGGQSIRSRHRRSPSKEPGSRTIDIYNNDNADNHEVTHYPIYI